MSEANEVKIGVFICHCGGNISDVVDVKSVAERVGKLPDVVISTTHMFMCSDPGQGLIEDKIKDLGLNRLIVAACSPTLHLPTFRRAAQRAGLNQFLVEHINIREHVSWVVEDKVAATDKATRLVTAAVGRVRYLEPLEMRSIDIHQKAMVIGGGVAGLIAARDLAARGMRVVLAEKRMFLGGRMAQLDTLYPTGERAWDLLGPLIQDVVNHPEITIHTGATLVEASGVVGDFRLKLRVRPRGVAPGVDNIADAVAACPVEADYAFNYGLNKRKAIYAPYRDAMWPREACIVWDDCTKCGDCVKAVSGQGIDLNPPAQEIEVQAGVVVLATGYHPYEPKAGEYGWGQPGVVTLQQLNRMMNPEGPTGGRVEVNGKPVKRLAFIHCVGACEREGVHAQGEHGKVNDYCARTCCTATMHAALELQQRDPELQTASFHQHIRTYGRGHEDYYDRASAAGMLFLRHPGDEPPTVVSAGADGLLVRSRDLLTDGVEVEYPADMVVLSTGVVPRDHGDLRELFKCTIGADNFLSEVHPKLRPVEIAVSGIMVAGACQAPMDITEASAAASAAASKAAAMISQGAVLMDPFIAQVNESLCSDCQTCLTVCPYDAIHRIEADGVARVDEALCTGCGTCHAACPSAAIQQYGFTDDQVMAEVQMLLDGKLADLTA